MPRVWVSLGSNQERETSLRLAVRELRQEYGDLRLSPVYECAAVGFAGAPFLNLVVGFSTDQSVAEVRARLRAIEDAAGRVRGAEKFAPRTLDLDLLTYGAMVGVIDGYELPRDEILRFAFVLKPLADLAGAEIHPLTGRTYDDLWRHFAGEPGALVPYHLDLAAVTQPVASARQPTKPLARSPSAHASKSNGGA